MITTGNLPFFTNSIYDVQLDIGSPIDGFEFSLIETGTIPSFEAINLVTFSGKEGFVFDQSGNFFAGYISGVPLDLEIHYDYTNKTFSYYHGGVLIANGLDVTGAVSSAAANMETGKVNHVSFTKHGDSSLSITATGAIS